MVPLPVAANFDQSERGKPSARSSDMADMGALAPRVLKLQMNNFRVMPFIPR